MPNADWWKTFFSGVALDVWRQTTTAEQTRAECDFIEGTLQVAPPARVLDVPCGNGRHSLELASRGWQVTGVDMALPFLEEARSKSAERQLKIAWERRDMRDLPWPKEFDAAFCFGNSFGYMTDNGNAEFLQAVARVLKPGARFILDTQVAETILPTFQERRWYQFGEILFLIENRYDHVHGRLDTEYTFVQEGKVDRRASSHRIYAYRELCEMLEEAGFENCEGYGSLGREPFKLGAERLLLATTRK